MLVIPKPLLSIAPTIWFLIVDHHGGGFHHLRTRKNYSENSGIFSEFFGDQLKRLRGHHRPTTRSKNKRSRPDENSEATTEIPRKIILNKMVNEDDVHQLYNVWRPVGQGCRVNTKDNPSCFCGLIPPPNRSRKSGFWQKTSEIVNSLGPDQSKDLHSSSDTPAGLTNLGATCYANSILQCLYMNKSFREGVFSVEPRILEGEPVLNNLIRLFAQLHSIELSNTNLEVHVTEEGFRGTLLTSAISSQAVSEAYLN